MRKHHTVVRDRAATDDGFGLVEIIISMFLLALLAVAFLPLLVDSLRATSRNMSIATASQLASEQLDAITLVDRTCAAFDAFEAAALPSVTDDRGVVYQPVRVVSACPATFPGSVTITVSVTVSNEPGVVVDATTFAVVDAGS